MKKNDEINQLDALLGYLKDQPNAELKNVGQITNDVKLMFPATENDVFLMLKKLVKDHFASMERVDITKPSFVTQPRVYEQRYRITFEGKLFLQLPGGYAAQRRLNANDETRLKKLENDQIANQKTLNRLTYVIALGTAIPAIYYFIQLCELFQDWCRCEFIWQR
jgi:hypothetical protein